MKFKSSNGAITEVTDEDAERLCARLRGKAVLSANKGDLVLAASIIENLWVAEGSDSKNGQKS